MPVVKQNIQKFTQPNLNFAIPSPRLSPPSCRDRGYAVSLKYPKEAAIKHPIQRKHLCDTFPTPDNNLVKSLNRKAVFFVGSHIKLNFLIDLFLMKPKSTALKGLHRPDNPVYFKPL